MAHAGQWEQAIEDAQKCIDIKPDWSKGYQRKGMAMEGKGDLEEAIKLYETGIDKDPANAQCKSMLESAEAKFA